MDTGISKAYAVIANKLRENGGVNVELYRLYDAVRKGTIKMRGQGFNFAKIRDQIYAQLAATIGREFEYNLLIATSSLSESQIQNDLNELMANDLIVHQRRVDNDSYIFKTR